MYRKCLLVLVICLLSIAARTYSQSCKPPFSFKFEEFTRTSVKLKWSDANNSPSGWEIELIKKGQQPAGIHTHGPVQQREIDFTGLEPSTAYEVYIRTVCSATSISSWNVAIPFTTVLEIPTKCSIGLPLKDNGTETFLLDVPETGILGKDIFLKSIDLIVEHDWPADLKITLVSPQGQQLVLSNHNGTVYDDFGLPGDTTCTGFTRIAPGACRQLKESTPPYLGTFRPDGDPDLWKTDTLTGGYWKLIFLDRALKDVGKLRYANISFSNQKCLTPVNFILAGADVSELTVAWEIPAASCNTVRISILKPDGSTQEVFVECSEKKYTFSGLEPNTAYVLSIAGICSDFSQSQESCTITATTTCEEVSVAEGFDNKSTCTEGCGAACLISGSLWYNETNDGGSDWIIWAGPTDTDNTGPSGDISGEGRYVYLENNPAICGSGSAVALMSECIDVRHNASGCDMSFYYHMFGSDITGLSLEASIDEGLTWETLMAVTGDQGDKWNRKTLSLANYHGKKTVFRFVAVSSGGVLGDIALDQIEFYGSRPSTAPATFYRDEDGDGYGISTSTVSVCRSAPPAGYASVLGDCDDTNPAIRPGATEIQCNAVDENCNGSMDDRPEANPVTYVKSITHPSCNGSADGRIQLTISGGNPPYTVTWNNQLTGNDIIGLSPGIYAAEIRDLGGCKVKTEFIELTAQSVLSVLVDQRVQPSCNGRNDGSVSIVHSAGSEPYLYKWSTGATTKDLTSAGEGKYSVTVTDGRNCTAMLNDIVLTARPSVITGILTQKNPLCFGQTTGAVELISFGGSPPYKYQWANGQTASKINMVPAGMYTCTVSDQSGCLNVFTATVESPRLLSGKVISTENVRCFGEKNGSVKSESSGGTPPYTYLWSNFSVSEDIFNLKAGTYTLTITDNNGCNAVLPPVVISEPDEMLISADSIGTATCILGNNGFVSVNVQGGNGDYQFSWNHTATSTPQQDSLLTGNYSVTSFDKLGCKASLPNIFIPYVNDDLGVEISVLQENKCQNKSEAILTAKVSKGDPLYDFNWNLGIQYFSGSAADTLRQLPGGTYQLTVTDRTGCTGVSQQVIIPVLPPYYYTVDSVIQNRCQSDSTGAISIAVTGGKRPYSISWNNGTYAGADLSGLADGQYAGTILDSLGCLLDILPVTVSSLSDLKIHALVVPDTNFTSRGSLCFAFTGGKPPYSISVNSAATASSCLKNLPPGVYLVELTDSDSCTVSESYTVENISATSNISKGQLVVYPNPAGDRLNIRATAIEDISIYGMGGRLILQKFPEHKVTEAVIDTGGLLPGVYLVKITAANSSSYKTFVKL